MASFLRQTFSTLFLTFVFVIIFAINPSYGDYDDPEEMAPLRGTELAMLICNHTSYNKFCVDKLTPVSPDASARDMADSALHLAQTAAHNTRVVIANLLDSSSSMKQKERRILQKCQLDNNVTGMNILAARYGLKLNIIDSMIDDLNTAGNATKSCQDSIKRTRFSATLSDKNMDAIRLCKICVVSTQFFTF
ncbi:Pectinesterase inhibitor [Corchorus capsularis]|uniref:Pectinesterase inhibitor n=1 Tax=Corchorus capsularis TaxID=210143 RepID=A0A1R3H8A0_COCAP|nr:Pectinesterase inhibitor [Corchorus capsularis]